MKTALMTLSIVILTAGAVFSAFVKVDLQTTAAINDIYFADDQRGWAVTSAGEVFYTYDGGKTWKLNKVGTRGINAIHVPGRYGYLAGEKGLLMKSTDRGATWKDASLNLKYNFTGVGVLGDSNAVVVGVDLNSMAKTRGEVFQSFDYGKSWKKHPSHLGNGYTDLAVCAPHKYYILATKKAFHSVSSGIFFVPGAYEGKRLAFSFDFIDDWGFLVGADGLFSKSITHGKKWENVDLGLTMTLYSVKMFDKFSGVAVGQGGTVIYFYDSGGRKIVDNCGEKVDLLAVGVTSERIFCGGHSGAFFYTTR